MAELVDALDSKSSEAHTSCRFDPDHRHFLMTIEPLIIRAHHLLCIQGFRGYGYNKEFTANLREIVRKINSTTSLCAKIVCECDIICSKCPHNIDGRCEKKRVKELDQIVLKELNQQKGKRVLLSNVLKQVREVFNDRGKLNKTCQACQWKDVCGWFTIDKATN